MFSNLKKIFLNFYYKKKLINLNKQIFADSCHCDSKRIFLIEFNAFHNLHAVYSVFGNFYKKKFNCNIHAFFNYSLLSSSLQFSFINKIKWNIGNFFSLRNFGVYRSFGVKKIFRPSIDKNIRNFSENIFKKTFYKIRKKEDILNLKVHNILIGDLLYDTYLKSKITPTIDILSNDFKLFYIDFLKLFFFWYNFFKRNNVCGVATSHCVYSYAVILRIAKKKKVPAFILSTNYLSKFKNENYGGSINGNFINYKNEFKCINKIYKEEGIRESREILKKKFTGEFGAKVKMDYTDVSSFSKIKNNKKILVQNNKFKVLISTHDFFDAVHFYGKSFFPDFYEWLIFLCEVSKKTNYDWYIKNHPAYGGKYIKYQKFTDAIVKNLVQQYKHIKLIPNDISNKQLIAEGIGAVLTVYGTVASEYPYFGIPVLNASKLNPHCSYNFSRTPDSQRQYKRIIMNLNNLSVPKNARKQIIEYYFMRHLFVDENWLFKSYVLMLEKIGGYHNLQSYNFYKYWVNYCNKKLIKEVEIKIERFLTNKDPRLSIIN